MVYGNVKFFMDLVLRDVIIFKLFSLRSILFRKWFKVILIILFI